MFTTIFAVYFCGYGKSKNERLRKNLRSTNETWLSQVTRPGSTNKDASFIRTSDILTLSFIRLRGLAVRVATTLVYQTRRRWFDSRHH